jgi:hypothetical protein
MLANKVTIGGTHGPVRSTVSETMVPFRLLEPMVPMTFGVLEIMVPWYLESQIPWSPRAVELQATGTPRASNSEKPMLQVRFRFSKTHGPHEFGVSESMVHMILKLGNPKTA